MPPPACSVCQEIFSIWPRNRKRRSSVSGREQPLSERFFAHSRGFHASGMVFTNRRCHGKNRSKVPHWANSKEKTRRAAPGEDGSTDILSTGVPKPPPAFPRSKKFSQAALLHPFIACFVPTPGRGKCSGIPSLGDGAECGTVGVSLAVFGL
jgi:hypothetical protein